MTAGGGHFILAKVDGRLDGTVLLDRREPPIFRFSKFRCGPIGSYGRGSFVQRGHRCGIAAIAWPGRWAHDRDGRRRQ